MKYRIFGLLLLFCFVLSGCGNNSKELEEYKASIEKTCAYVEKINEAINNIDATETTANEELLEYLDILNDTFIKMKEIEVPEQLEALKELQVKASEDMTEAVALYHAAYENGYSDVNEAKAYDLYVKANKEFKMIIVALRGDEANDADSDDSNTDDIDNESQDSDTEFVEDDYSQYLEDDNEDYYEAYKEETNEEETNEEDSESSEEE